MDDLVRWLGVQLDEDERTARRAADYDDGAAHDVHGPPGTWACMDEAEWFGPSYRGGVIAPRIGNVNAPELGAHIVRHDPARVLREIDAKRQALDHYARIREHTKRGDEAYVLAEGAVAKQIQIMATAYDHRPGYRDDWRP
ncbi:DUF6221 family protein [Streptomyces albogriseolus]|uniref:DUF6221 family protein n=1 Tax=Streptomyces albogriseolus TaxID=1887 RepID=UPI003CE7B0EB